MPTRQSGSPQFEPELVDGFTGGRALSFFAPVPLSTVQTIWSSIAPVSLDGGHEQHGISTNRQSGGVSVRRLSSHLGLPHSQDCLFISEVHFDVPPPQIPLQQLLQRQIGV